MNHNFLRVVVCVLLSTIKSNAQAPSSIEKECAENITAAVEVYKNVPRSPFKNQQLSAATFGIIAGGVRSQTITMLRESVEADLRAAHTELNRITTELAKPRPQNVSQIARIVTLTDGTRVASNLAVESQWILISQLEAKVENIKFIEKDRIRRGLSLAINSIIAEGIDSTKAINEFDILEFQGRLTSQELQQVRRGMQLMSDSGKVTLKEAFERSEQSLIQRQAKLQAMAAAERAAAQAEIDAIAAFQSAVRSKTIASTGLRGIFATGGRLLAWASGVFGAFEIGRIIEQNTTARVHAAGDDETMNIYTEQPERLFEALKNKQFTSEHICRKIRYNYALGRSINGEILALYRGTGIQAPIIHVGPTMGPAPSRTNNFVRQ